MAAVTRRSVLRGMAGMTALAAAGCKNDPGHPWFLDIAGDQLLRDGAIVRLKVGTEHEAPTLILLGSTSTADSNVPITIESTQRRVLLGADQHVGSQQHRHAATLSHDRPVAVWANALATGNPGEAADTLVVSSHHGQLRLTAWIEPVTGQWIPADDPLPDIGIVAVHAALMRSGMGPELLAFSPPRVFAENGLPKRDEHSHEVWDLPGLHDVEIRAIDLAFRHSTPRPERLIPVINLFCSGHAHLPTGQLLTAGSHISGNSIFDPSANYLHIYNAASGSWRRSTARLRRHRWYPTVTALPDGRMLIASGASQALADNPVDRLPFGFYGQLVNSYEIYDPATDRMVGVRQNQDLPNLVDLPVEEPVDHLPAGAPISSRPLATYPAVFVVPGGRRHPDGVLLLQEANRGWVYEYRSGAEPQLVRAPRRYEMPGKGSRSYPYYGSAVLLPFEDGATQLRMLVVGGADESRDDHLEHPDEGPATATTVIFDYDAARELDQQSGWRHAGDMSHPRVLCDATLLPDGQVLVTGGVSKGWANRSYRSWAVRQAELFDPDGETFRPVAGERLDRRYHSTALLLPDGTVVKMGSTGGFEDGVGQDGRPWIDSHTQVDVYHPPYLWRNPRPRVSNSPETLGYGGPGVLEVTGYQINAARIVLMKAGSVTHGLNMDQRCVFLPVVAHGSPEPVDGGLQRVRLTFRGPSTAGTAPPGPYLLFVLDNWGVPSVGGWCLLG